MDDDISMVICRMRDGSLNVNLFNTLLEARFVILKWIKTYNKTRRQSSYF